MISLVKWEAWEALNHSKCLDLHIFSQFLWRGGKRGSPESLEMYNFLTFVFDFVGGVGSVGSPESLKMRIDFMHFSYFFSVKWKRGDPGIIENV